MVRDVSASLAAMALPPRAGFLAAFAAPIGFGWQRLLCKRLHWLSEHSPLSAEALHLMSRAIYLGAGHLLALPLLLLAGLALSRATGQMPGPVLLALAAYGAGALLASSLRRRGPSALKRGSDKQRERRPRQVLSGPRAILGAVVRKQTLGSRYPAHSATATILAAFLATGAAVYLTRGQGDQVAIVAAVFPSFLLLLMTSRTDPQLIGFLPYLGYPARFVALAVTILPTACLLAALAALLVMRPSDPGIIGAILLAMHAAFLLVSVARAWLYPGRGARSVDLQVQLEFAGLVLAAFVFPPLAVVMLAWRMWSLRRDYSSLLWVQL